MTVFVRNYALEFVARKHRHASARHADGRIAGGMSGRERVDAGFPIHHVHLRDRHAGSDCYFLDDVQQLALMDVGGIGVHQPTLE